MEETHYRFIPRHACTALRRAAGYEHIANEQVMNNQTGFLKITATPLPFDSLSLLCEVSLSPLSLSLSLSLFLSLCRSLPLALIRSLYLFLSVHLWRPLPFDPFRSPLPPLRRFGIRASGFGFRSEDLRLSWGLGSRVWS